LNMTNEGGLDRTYRLLKNIMGLWLVQQCKRSFDAAGRKYDYGQLAALAAEAKALLGWSDAEQGTPGAYPLARASGGSRRDAVK
jgi:rhamnulokinase